ncbi:DNA repair protein RadC [Myxococcota bacterium]|nr:DNA repair protein RadC [Myxococcota bacterium]
MQAREHYAAHGPSPLADDALLALVLGTGVAGRPAPAIARALLDRCDGLPGLARAPVQTLASVPGVGLARAVRVHAALALARRVDHSRRLPSPEFSTPDDAWRFLAPRMEDAEVEELHAIYLNRRRRLLAHRALTRGSDSHTVVDPRQVFRAAVELAAAAVIVAHNHPSGDPTPSEADAEVTRRLAAAGRVLGIPLLDHLVLVRGGYTSLAEQGVLPRHAPDGRVWVEQPGPPRPLSGPR